MCRAIFPPAPRRSSWSSKKSSNRNRSAPTRPNTIPSSSSVRQRSTVIEVLWAGTDRQAATAAKSAKFCGGIDDAPTSPDPWRLLAPWRFTLSRRLLEGNAAGRGAGSGWIGRAMSRTHDDGASGSGRYRESSAHDGTPLSHVFDHDDDVGAVAFDSGNRNTRRRRA